MSVKQALKQTMMDVDIPKLRHGILKSLSEVQSERDNAPECKECSDPLDEDRWEVGICLDCQSELDREQRKAYAREYGEVDERDQFAGRGMPRG